MPLIKTFKFEKEKLNLIKSYNYGTNWPVVYILENKHEVYIGETTNAFGRCNQHYEKSSKNKLERIHIITDEQYNKSAALDIESSLIQYMAADGTFLLQNGNNGLLNHNYFDKERYQAKFEIIWKQLQNIKLAKKDLIQIRNSDLFKYSPYKALSNDQLEVVKKIIDGIKQGSKRTYIIKGGPGTGKTIIATYLIKALKELNQTKDLEIAIVISMTSLRNTIQEVFRNVKGLNSGMVIGPNQVTNKKYDILIVDEAHRLRQRRNIVNYRSFDETNKKLGLDKKGNELDWIIQSSKTQIIFYDKDQSIRPSDINHEDFPHDSAEILELKKQMRVSVGEEGEKYIDFIQDLFDLRDTETYEFSKYDLRIYDDLQNMINEIKEKDKEVKLSRVVAGYAWPWVSRKNPKKHDIEIGEVKLFWNRVNNNWVNSENAVNEVGCIHTVQGYDLNYTGVIIGPELSYDDRKGELIIFPEKYMDSNGSRGIDDPEELKRYIINIYKTLLTRGIDGTYIYIVDKRLREYVYSKISKIGKGCESY